MAMVASVRSPTQLSGIASLEVLAKSIAKERAQALRAQLPHASWGNVTWHRLAQFDGPKLGRDLGISDRQGLFESSTDGQIWVEGHKLPDLGRKAPGLPRPVTAVCHPDCEGGRTLCDGPG